MIRSEFHRPPWYAGLFLARLRPFALSLVLAALAALLYLGLGPSDPDPGPPPMEDPSNYVQAPGEVVRSVPGSGPVTLGMGRDCVASLRVTYRYTVQGRAFESSRYSFVRDEWATDSRLEVPGALSRYERGKPVTVYHHRERPWFAVLSLERKGRVSSRTVGMLAVVTLLVAAVIFSPFLSPRVKRALNPR